MGVKEQGLIRRWRRREGGGLGFSTWVESKTLCYDFEEEIGRLAYDHMLLVIAAIQMNC